MAKEQVKVMIESYSEDENQYVIVMSDGESKEYLMSFSRQIGRFTDVSLLASSFSLGEAIEIIDWCEGLKWDGDPNAIRKFKVFIEHESIRSGYRIVATDESQKEFCVSSISKFQVGLTSEASETMYFNLDDVRFIVEFCQALEWLT